jgi:acetyl esterase/lipase
MQMARAMSMPSVFEARQLVDSIEFKSPLPHRVRIEKSDLPDLQGYWLHPENAVPDRAVMYLHGGGYAFFARAHLGMIGQVACAASARTFALDYRLTPEHPYPAQLDDAYAAYRELLARGLEACRLIVAGDSAGGHLVLSLLNRLSHRGEPMPALGLCLCPWSEIGPVTDELFKNDRYDWVQGSETLQFARWFQGDRSVAVQDISPINFDFRGFPPLYLQAGGREVFHNMILRFAHRVAESDEEITLDVWAEMTHDFQAYGSILPESRQALARISEAVDHYLNESSGRSLPASMNTVVQGYRNAEGTEPCPEPQQEPENHLASTSVSNRLLQLH